MDFWFPWLLSSENNLHHHHYLALLKDDDAGDDGEKEKGSSSVAFDSSVVVGNHDIELKTVSSGKHDHYQQISKINNNDDDNCEV
jgi:hypothetical protein